ncbi:MAG: hypothetical protein IMZ60_00820 [Actinobacteria bacterium]|nr:hypothetical protein [Actinomycetota bacterium]
MKISIISSDPSEEENTLDKLFFLVLYGEKAMNGLRVHRPPEIIYFLMHTQRLRKIYC